MDPFGAACAIPGMKYYPPPMVSFRGYLLGGESFFPPCDFSCSFPSALYSSGILPALRAPFLHMEILTLLKSPNGIARRLSVLLMRRSHLRLVF